MLIGRRVLECKALHFLLRQVGTGPNHHKRERLLALDLVRYRYDAGLHNIGVPLEHAFDLTRIDILSTANEHVVGATDKRICTTFIATEYVARFVPAVAR